MGRIRRLRFGPLNHTPMNIIKLISCALVLGAYLVLCTLAGLFLYGSHRGEEALNDKEDSQ